MMNPIHAAVAELLHRVGVIGDVVFTVPPNAALGDIAFACFAYAKETGSHPKDAAAELAEKLLACGADVIASAQAMGPYLNITLNAKAVIRCMEQAYAAVDVFGAHTTGNGKKLVIEYACPNPLKAFHLGHLKNLITGEAVVRMFENAGYSVVRVNYQGDVGMHVAKALWGIYDWRDQFEAMQGAPLRERVEFLGKAYAHGAAAYEESEEKKQEVIAYNDKVYERAPEVQEVYQTARAWSLEYFDTIYARLGTSFDRLYFESEMYERGVEIVREFLPKGVFKESEGAVIFEGSAVGLHDRVFVNSKGFPTYEAKDLALAERHFADHSPDQVIHVVGKEQTEYFQVVFKALESTLPQSRGKEYHLPGGFLQLKGGKMSSRLGNIVTGDALLDAVTEQIAEIMKDVDIADRDTVVERVTAAALKYAMLRADVSKDVAFDMEASVSTSGDSGPYLLYIVARIRGILEKAEGAPHGTEVPDEIVPQEKQLVLKLAEFPAVTFAAADSYDPSKVARYLFELAQAFNSFYDACPVIQSEGPVRTFRLRLLGVVQTVMARGLWILGIETVERM